MIEGYLAGRGRWFSWNMDALSRILTGTMEFHMNKIKYAFPRGTLLHNKENVIVYKTYIKKPSFYHLFFKNNF